jgi:hypothetical protein
MNRKFSLDPDHVLLLTNRKRKLPARQEDGYKIQGYVMNEKAMVVGDVEAQGVDIIDLGDATAETRQPHDIMQINDSAMTFTYWG